MSILRSARVFLAGLCVLAGCGEIKSSSSDLDAGGDASASDAPNAVGCPTPCGANAACVNVAGVDSCQCAPGFAGDGFLCTNIDECASGAHACDPSTRCTDRTPLYECSSCPGGTRDMDPGIGTKCQVDVPDSMQVVPIGGAASPTCGTVADADLDGDGVDGQLASALLVNGATGMDGPASGRNPNRPLKTIGYALAVAAADPDRNQIYVASTDEQGQPITYAEALVLPRGVHLFGGYTHDFKSRQPAQRTKVAPATGVPLVVDYVGNETLAGSYVIEGFSFEAAAAAAPGASSIAVLVQDEPRQPGMNADAGVADAAADAGPARASAQASLLNNTLIAGAGAPGADGRRPDRGLDGCPGKEGAPESTARTEGFATTSNCFAGAPGAHGGAGRTYVGEDGGDSGEVKGGLGGKTDNFGYSVCWCPASVGEDGQPGSLGAPPILASRPGVAAQGLGSFRWENGRFIWNAAPGEKGAAGSPGRGGSGGGASYGGCGGTPCRGIAGSSGGAGGGGGEAGPGGEGGGGGGASLGLAAIHAQVGLGCLTITTANGGPGGRGGPGAPGGRGGPGGPGGAPGIVSTSRSGVGGKGGPGSDGTPGFAGQGGRGGPSVGVLLSQAIVGGLDPAGADTHTITLGQPGAGGPETGGSEPGYAGEPGVATRVLTVP